MLDGDVAYGSAAEEVRLGGIQPVPATDEGARTERRVDLVPGEHEVVDPCRRHIHRAVRNQLRAIDRETGAVAMGEHREFGERQHLAGDIGRPRDREQRERLLFECGGYGCHGRGEAGTREQHTVFPALPRQQVGVVLDVENEHRAADRPGKEVQRVRAVAGEDHEVVVACAEAMAHGVPGRLVEGGAHLGEVPGTPVHAGVVGQHLVDVRPHGEERRGARGIVEVGVRDLAARHERYPYASARDR